MRCALSPPASCPPSIMVVAAEHSGALGSLRELMCEAVTRPTENVTQTIKACMYHKYVSPIGVGVMTKAKGWVAKDAPGGTFVILDHRAPKLGPQGTTLERSHS